MIKFFRRIRQNLLSENKFSKYLIYAIGEIFLVVIGILIALQLNNRNQEQKQEQQFKTNLALLHKAISDDLTQLNITIDANNYHISLCDTLIKHAPLLIREDIPDFVSSLFEINVDRAGTSNSDSDYYAERLTINQKIQNRLRLGRTL